MENEFGICICPACGGGSLRPQIPIVIRPGNDVVLLRLTACGWCSLKACVFSESPHQTAQGIALSELEYQQMSAWIKSCPSKLDPQCRCSGHVKLSAPMTRSKTFAMTPADANRGGTPPNLGRFRPIPLSIRSPLPDWPHEQKVPTGFICPICDRESLAIGCGIELPPDLTDGSDELTLSLVRCLLCSFSGSAIYEESRRGSLSSEDWNHDCVAAPPDALGTLAALILSCPDRKKWRCSCPAHFEIALRDPSGHWVPPVPISGPKRFPIRRVRR